MKLHRRSVLQLHDLYHRKEGERYVIGDPETGKHLTITAAELRVTRLIASGLELERIEELIREEKDRVDVHEFIHALEKKGLIHTINSRIVMRKHEPLHEISFEPVWIANPALHYLLVFVALAGIFTLAWRGTIPGPGAFLVQESLFLSLLAAIIVLWLFVFIREIAKHGHARALGLQSRFGVTNHYHWFLPKTFLPPTTDEQEHRIIASSLLTALAVVMFTGIQATYTASPWWTFIFLIGIFELLAECLLFLDTDLAKYIGFKSNIHALNEQTKQLVIEDWAALWRGEGKAAHIRVSSYAFLYLSSIVLAVTVFAAYILPIAADVVTTAFERLVPSSPLFFDAAAALTLLTLELLLYGFATLKRHPLAHNTFFVNISLASIVLASFFVASLAVSWTDVVNDLFIAALLLYATGIVLALVFERAVVFAHPFNDLHTVYESVVLPTVAACVPLSILFTIPGEVHYFQAGILALGMLSAIAILEMQRVATAVRASTV